MLQDKLTSRKYGMITQQWQLQSGKHRCQNLYIIIIKQIILTSNSDVKGRGILKGVLWKGYNQRV